MRPEHVTARTSEALTLSARLPDLLMSARQVATSVAHGLHGRRRAGNGETFWQFRRFQLGEPARRIDWRRSARDDLLYVREREWEAAHTVWLWTDLSPSMDYQSHLASVSKRDRAVVLALAIADLVVRGGERVALPGLMAPTARRQAAERVARAMAVRPEAMQGFPELTSDLAAVSRFSDLVVFGDFLDPIADITARVAAASAEGIRGHLVQIVDPAEESFPFEGRTEFEDPESGPPVVFGRASEAREHFTTRMSARRKALRDALNHAGWSLLVHHTDQPPSHTLMALHNRLTVNFDTRKAAWRPDRPLVDGAVT